MVILRVSVGREIGCHVDDFLNDDDQAERLTFKEMRAFTFFALQSVLNIRPGPILNITITDYECLKKGIRLTTKHKTGYMNAVAIEVPKELIKHLNKMLAMYQEQYKKNPKYLFCSPSGKPLTTIPRDIDEVFTAHFDKNTLQNFRFGATNVRKSWDTEFEKNPEFKNKYSKAHEQQSGHSEITRKKYYAKRPDKDSMSGLLSYYHDRLSSNKSKLQASTEEHEKEPLMDIEVPYDTTATEKHFEPVAGPSVNKKKQVPAQSLCTVERRKRPRVDYSNMEISDIEEFSEEDSFEGNLRKEVGNFLGEQDDTDSLINIKARRNAKPKSQKINNQKLIRNDNSERDFIDDGRTMFQSTLTTYKGSKFDEKEVQVVNAFRFIDHQPTKKEVQTKFQEIHGFSKDSSTVKVYLKVLQTMPQGASICIDTLV